MTALAATDIRALGGATIPFTTSTASDTAPCGPPDHPNTLLVNNTSGATRTVTIVTPNTVSGLAVADATIVVPTGTIRGAPLPSTLYADPADGLAHLSTDTPGATCTLAVISPG